jgi:RNA polymerase sigma factor (sigma-70 family)
MFPFLLDFRSFPSNRGRARWFFMNDESAMVQSALDRFNTGDQAEKKKALNDLFAHARQRLERIAHRLLYGDRLAALVQTGTVMQEASIRLWQALDTEVAQEKAKVRILTAAQFFRFSSCIMRRLLIELARSHNGPNGWAVKHVAVPVDVAGCGAPDPKAAAPDVIVAENESFQRLLERMNALPEDLRDVSDLHMIHACTLADTASVLGVSVPTVKRRLREAKAALINLVAR